MQPPVSVFPINVSVRIRPFSEEEYSNTEDRGDVPAWRVSTAPKNIITEIINEDNHFAFDAIHDEKTTTAEVYRSQLACLPLRVANGLNATVMAYGQTGSGKSFTMLGDPALPRGTDGVLAWSIRDLFSTLEAECVEKPNLSVAVFVSVIEIYNEQLRDLLLVSEDGRPLHAPSLSIRERPQGVYVHHAQRRQVRNAKECIDIIFDHVDSRRLTAATGMNELSSRSHCIITLDVERLFITMIAPSSPMQRALKNEEGEDGASEASESMGTFMDPPPANRTVYSTLHIVDLAGSERVSKTGATGTRMTEGGYINKSLSTLTTVIQRLSESAKNPRSVTFVPYRDSRLTHLLKTALGGNAVTSIVACISPSAWQADESRSTLQFASRAKQIKNRVGINEVVDPELRVKELEELVKSLSNKVAARTLAMWSAKLRLERVSKQLNERIKADAQRRQVETETRGSKGSGSTLASAASPSSLIHTPHPKLTDALSHGVRDGATLEEVAQEREELRHAFQELDTLCRELEQENAAQATRIQTLTSQLPAGAAENGSGSQPDGSNTGNGGKVNMSATAEGPRVTGSGTGGARIKRYGKSFSTSSSSGAARGAAAGTSIQAAAAGGSGKAPNLGDGDSHAPGLLALNSNGTACDEEREKEQEVCFVEVQLKDLENLESRLEEMEKALLEKDALRDAIVETKLSRVQELAVYLHSTNAGLKEELQKTVRDRNALIEEIYAKKPDLQKLKKHYSNVLLSADKLVEAANQKAKLHLKPHGHN